MFNGAAKTKCKTLSFILYEILLLVQHTATHCSTPQRPATQCNLLQHASVLHRRIQSRRVFLVAVSSRCRGSVYRYIYIYIKIYKYQNTYICISPHTVTEGISCRGKSGLWQSAAHCKTLQHAATR